MKRTFATIVALAAAVAPAAFGTTAAVAQAPSTGPSAAASVIGGRTATIAEFPWLAFIAAITDEGPFSCTGAVVAPRVVLTAGHCIEKPEELAAFPASDYRVVTGISDLRTATSANASKVSRAIFYPTFETAKLQIDAGLLILSAPVAAPVLPLASAADAEVLKAGTPISIAGWGLTAPRAAAGPSTLRAAELVLQSQGSCRRGTRPYEPFYSPAGQLCALDPGRTMSGCFGDSGGPAIARRADGTPVEVGIIVSGGPECSRRLPNIYTSAEKISGWVAGWVAATEAGAPAPPTPTASPPYLSFDRAIELGEVALRKAFHGRFTMGTDARASCKRLGWAKVRCRVSWRLGQKRFHGSFTAFYLVNGYRVRQEAEVRIRSSS
jgi:secreted trypsin-like serine protease